MSRVTQTWKRFRRWPAQHRAQLRLCLRVTTSAVVALAVAHFLNLPLALWTVLTAVLLTQISVGRSLKATVDYLASTLAAPSMPAQSERLFRTPMKSRSWARSRSQSHRLRSLQPQIRVSALRRSARSWCSSLRPSLMRARSHRLSNA
jgi:hypothetical protein